ncbi:muscle M-line assembly protein unc-89-like isoform X2 [Lingula anatina]|uniref:Muscle M-line assembly protein unc-89-like isoform X2 n=1 Tax=Lingula anatina TaxID=7574 RepID=A0A1S3KG21_LINAN|nr:muscle M-line assembly protein unc-89-like isoform X2 [Lingula anatina]|eukprot:XP_013421437.1 muscle M-line assembly protein unc-89-like isoform X2 [Lingula anatina]
MASGGEEGDAVGKQSEDEDKPQDTTQASDGKQEGKKRKFKPLKAMRRFFMGRKRSKTSDDQAVSIVAVRSAKSTSELLHVKAGEERPVTLAGNLSLSADSIFSPDQKKTSEVRDLKEAALSLEALNTQAINEFYHLPKPAFSPAKKESSEDGIQAKDVDLDAVKQTSALGNVAARHKMAIRPKSRRASSQFRSPQKSEPRPATPVLPSVNEEPPPKSSPKREHKEEKKTAKKFKDETDSKEKQDKEKDRVVAMETVPVISITAASPESVFERSTEESKVSTETKPVVEQPEAKQAAKKEEENMETDDVVLPKPASSVVGGGILLQDAKPPPPLLLGQADNYVQDHEAVEESLKNEKETVTTQVNHGDSEDIDHAKKETCEDEKEQPMEIEIVETIQPEKTERDIVIEPAAVEVEVVELKTPDITEKTEAPQPKERSPRGSMRAPYDNVVIIPREKDKEESQPDKSPARRRFQDRRSRTVPTSNTQSEEITKALGKRQSMHEEEEEQEKDSKQPSPKPLERFAHLKKKSPSEPTKSVVVIKHAKAVVTPGMVSSPEQTPEGSTAEPEKAPPKISASQSVSVKPPTPSVKPGRHTVQEKVDTANTDPPWVAMAKKREKLRQQQQQQQDGSSDGQTTSLGDGKAEEDPDTSKDADEKPQPVSFRHSLKQWQGKTVGSEHEKPAAKSSFKRETSPVKQPSQKDATQPEFGVAKQPELTKTSPFKQSLNKTRSSSLTEEKPELARASPFKQSLNKTKSTNETESKPEITRASPFKQSFSKTKSNPEVEEKPDSEAKTPLLVTLKQTEPRGKTIFTSSTGETPPTTESKPEPKKVVSPFKVSVKTTAGVTSPARQSSVKQDSEKENKDQPEERKFGSPLRRSLKQDSGPAPSKPAKPDVILRGKPAEPVINIEIIEKTPPKPKLAPVSSTKPSSDTTPPEKCSESAAVSRKSRVLDLVKNFQKLEVT